MSYAIGLDIGGTSVVGAVVRDDGAVISRSTIPTHSSAGVADGLARITQLVQRLLAQTHLTVADIYGVGAGATGSIDTGAGCIHNPYTLPGWDDLPLGPHLTAQTGLDVTIMGDCDVAVLGEHWVGAGRGAHNLMYITVGTGIGSGLVINDRLYRGVHNAACEFGHQAIDLRGPKCYCGTHGCVEVLCSGPAIALRAQEKALEMPGTGMIAMAGSVDAIAARHVCEAARLGDSAANRVIAETGLYLGEGIGNALNLLAPERLVMGGGVMQSWDLFEPHVAAVLARRESVVMLTRIPIVAAALGLNAGVIGAARAAFTRCTA